VQLNLPTPASALAIAAHPDDVEFGCGATFAKWSAAGAAVHHFICTDGSKGSWDPSTDVDKLVALRQDEQRAAAAALGATGQVVFGGWTDGELEVSLERRATIGRCIRELQPDVVITHDPWRRYRLHPDHRNAGFLALDAVVAARDPHFLTDLGVDAWRPSHVLLFDLDDDDVDHIEDVTGFADRKLAALLAHESQLRSTMDIEVGGDDEAAQRARFRRKVLDELEATGRRAGLSQAEPFKHLTP
jgi:LmbE family N-acetylglucosaminyl deacetylase